MTQLINLCSHATDELISDQKSCAANKYKTNRKHKMNYFFAFIKIIIG